MGKAHTEEAEIKKGECMTKQEKRKLALEDETKLLKGMIGKKISLYMVDGLWTIKRVHQSASWVSLLVEQNGIEKGITNHMIRSIHPNV